MLRIVFEYIDKFSHGKWNRQEGIFPSVDDCIKWYGLGKDCDYRIISVTPIH